MGNVQSQNPAHVRIYKNLLQIKNAQTRAEMIRTLLVAPEYVTSFRSAGIYGNVLAYIARVESGQQPAALPGEMTMTSVVTAATNSGTHIVDFRPPQIQQRPSAAVMKGKRNEKALNYFQNCLEVLGLEEEVALTEETLKKAYKRAALKAHPDKGGSEIEFEAITRAHAYLGEI